MAGVSALPRSLVLTAAPFVLVPFLSQGVKGEK